MSLFMIGFLVYMAFSLVAIGFYLYYVGFNKDDLFVLTMSRVEQIEFVYMFEVCLFGVFFYLLNFMV